MTFTTREKKKILNLDKQNIEKNIVRELLKETRLKRKWGIFFKSIFFAYLVMVFIFWLPESTEINLGQEDTVTALVKLEGIIGAANGLSITEIAGDLRRAFEDGRTKAVILSINSPGGSPVQSSNLYNEIKRLRKEFPDKAIYAVIQDICASGGYFVASAATSIFANESSLVGSIGVRFDSFGFVDSLERLGVERRLITAGKHKGMLDPFLPTSEQQLTHVQDLLGEIHKHFISSVRKGRAGKIKETEDIFSGMIWTGNKSIELGLVDDIGSVDSVAREIVKAERIINFTREKFPWEGSFGLFVRNLLSSWPKFY